MKRMATFLLIVCGMTLGILAMVQPACLKSEVRLTKPEPEPVEKEPKIITAEVKIIPKQQAPQVKKKNIKAPTAKKKKQAIIPPKVNNKTATPPDKLYKERLLVNQEMVQDGKQMIKEGENKIPFITADYSRIGFDTYLRKMKSLGGRMFVGDADRGVVLAEVMLRDLGRSFEFVGLDKNFDQRGAISLFRPRALTKEVFTEKVLQSAGKRFEARNLICAILLPLEKEAALLGALKTYLGRSRYSIDQFDVVSAGYILNAGSVELELTTARLRDSGKKVELSMTLSL